MPSPELGRNCLITAIKPQLTEPSVVDMEGWGIRKLYHLADKLIEEAEEKISKRLRKLRRKNRGRRKKKQEEQGNQVEPAVTESLD